MKILLIEDDKFLRTVLEKKMKNENFEVITAVDGEEAVQKLVEERPEFILLDIILPKKNGFIFLEEVKKDPTFKKIPVIILSNLGQEEDVKKGLAMGADDYLIKAKISLDDIVNKIKSIIEKSSQVTL